MSDAREHFGVSEFTTWPWPFERDVERYSANGIAAIEVCEFKLDARDCTAQLASIGSHAMTVSSVQTTVHSIFPDSLAPEPVKADERLQHIAAGIERIAPHVPQGTPFVVITGAPPEGDVHAAYDRTVVALEELATLAERNRVRIAFEPLNPILLNTDTALWGLDKALELVRRVARPSVGLCLDTWNVFETPNLFEVIEAAGDAIFLVQVSQWRLPRRRADRRNLGRGSIDNAAILRAVRRTGYAGRAVLEIFSDTSLPDSIWNSDLDGILRENWYAFERLWQESTP